VVQLDSWQTDGIFKIAALNTTQASIRWLRCKHRLEMGSRNVEAISKNPKERILDLFGKMFEIVSSCADLKTYLKYNNLEVEVLVKIFGSTRSRWSLRFIGCNEHVKRRLPFDWESETSQHFYYGLSQFYIKIS
jgi:hypothetical protein